MDAEDASQSWSAPRILRNLESESSYRTNLLTHASRFPEVAARTILCPLFSRRSLSQLQQSPAFSTLISMCNHAMARQRRYEADTYSDVSNKCKNENEIIAPAEEVTFAATVTINLLENSTINLEASLIPFIGTSQGYLLNILKKRLSDISHYSTNSSIEEEKKFSTSSRRTLSLLPQKKMLDNNKDQKKLPQRFFLPTGMASTTNVTHTVTPSERLELLKKLGNSPLPFQVRSREEVKQQQVNQKASEANMTVVLTDHIVPSPPWKRQRKEFDEIEENEDVVNLPTPISSELPLSPQESLLNATWVKEGDLVLVNGRVVHRETTKKNDNSTKREKESGRKLALEVKVEDKKKVTTESTKKKKINTKNERVMQATTSKTFATNPQNVPLKSKDEVLEIINNRSIPITLREALLIGLKDITSNLAEDT